MPEELNKTPGNNKWQFWFLVSFSLLLVVTFVYYLPLRFRFGAMHGNEVDDDEMEMMMHGERPADSHGVGEYREEGDVKEGLVVKLKPQFDAPPTPFVAGIPVRLGFFVRENPKDVPVGDFQIEHEKLMHVIGARSDLNEFFHIHPDPPNPYASIRFSENSLPDDFNDPLGKYRGALRSASPDSTLNKLFPFLNEGVFVSDYVFPKPGRYKIWSEVKREGVNHAFGHPEIIVEGEGPKEEGEVSFGRNVIAGSYQVALDVNEPIRAGRPTDLYFDIHTLTGGEVEVEPYLGAAMHLAVIKKDWSEFIHTHPEGDTGMEHGHSSFLPFLKAYAHGEVDDEAEHRVQEADDEVRFQTIFPSPGLYKVFAQFRPKGIDLPPDESLIAGFWIEAKEDLGFRFPVKLGLFLVSVIAIAGLGLGVRKFLKVKIG